MSAHEFISSHYDQGHEAIHIGTCSCGNMAFASLQNLPDTFNVFCSMRGNHHWTREVTLDKEIANLDTDKPGRKTLKGRMLSEIEAWNTQRALAPNADITSTKVIKYKPHIAHAMAEMQLHKQPSQPGSQGAVDLDQLHNIEELELDEYEVVTVASEAHERSPLLRPDARSRDMMANIQEIQMAQSDGLERASFANNDEEIQVAGTMHLARRMAVRYAPLVAHDAPLLFVAWYTGNAVEFYATLASVLPHYFIDIPAVLEPTVTPATVMLANKALASPVMQRALGFVQERFGLKVTDNMVALAPIAAESKKIYEMFKETYQK